MPLSLTSQALHSTLRELDWDVMSVDSSSHLGTIAEGDCETATQSSVGLPKRPWVTNNQKILYDLEESSQQSTSETITESDDHGGDICAILVTSKITFTMSKCNIILSMVALVLLLAIGYKWSGFLIALIIVTALLIHVMIIWWLNDEGFFFAAQRESDATSVTISNQTQQHYAKDDMSFSKAKSSSHPTPSRIDHV